MVLLSVPADYLPMAIMFVVAIGFVLTVIYVTHLLGPQRKSVTKLETFECGIEPQGNSRIPFSVKYLLVAILFVLFDVEVIFMYPWAVNFLKLGLFGFIEMIVFICLFMLGFLYIVKKGALKWE
jgi:NADH-quinone oxidoreductase subunit A